MTIPVLIFILFLSAFLGCIFHLIIGGSVFHVFAYMVASTFGFMAGQLLCSLLGSASFSMGKINFIWGTVGSIIVLLLSSMLSRPLF